ncbi:MAG: hypothetical protein AAF790_01015, partial [Planctomycetota bacterium]
MTHDSAISCTRRRGVGLALPVVAAATAFLAVGAFWAVEASAGPARGLSGTGGASGGDLSQGL